MQFSVPIISTVKFAEHFYNSLSNSKNLINAMTQGRKVIDRDNTWFIPTLYGSNLTDDVFIEGNSYIGTQEHNLQPILFEQRYYEPNFIGRSEQLIKLSKSVSSTRTNCIVIWGPGGIGKTSLLKQFILRQHWRFNDEIVWIDLKGGKSLNEILVQICVDLKLDHDNVEDLKSFTLNSMGSKSSLVVFDNFDDVESDNSILEFIKLIPRPTRVMITARNNPYVLNWKKIQLYKLSLKESFRLFCQLAEDVDVIFNESDSDLINEICVVIDGHPLALVLVASMLLSNSIHIILNKIKSSTLKGIDLALDVSYNNLNTTDQEMIQKLSVFDSYFDEEAIRFVSEMDDFEDIKDELVRCSFIHFDGKKFALHPVIKQYVYNKVINKKKYHLKAAKYYQSQKLYFPMVDQLYYAEEWNDFVATMLRILSPLSLRRMHNLDDALTRVDMVYSAAEKIGNNKLKGEVHRTIGLLYRQVGYFEKSLEKYNNAYNLAVQIDDFDGKCRSLTLKIHAYWILKEKPSKILDLINEVETLIDDTEDEDLIYSSLLGCADGYLFLGIENGNKEFIKKSIRLYKKAIKIMKKLEKDSQTCSLIAIAYHSIGQANMVLKDDKTGLKYLNKSLKIKKLVGDLYGSVITLGALSDFYEESGELNESKKCLEEIIEISNQIQFSNVLEYDYLKLGKIKLILEDNYEEVADLFIKAVLHSLNSRDNSINIIMGEIENELIELSKKEGVLPPAIIIGFLMAVFTDEKFLETLSTGDLAKIQSILPQLENMPHKIDNIMG